jgi:hypothetical protein
MIAIDGRLVPGCLRLQIGRRAHREALGIKEEAYGRGNRAGVIAAEFLESPQGILGLTRMFTEKTLLDRK